MKLLNITVLNIMLLGGLILTTCNKTTATERPEAKKMKAISTEIRGKVAFPEELIDQNVNEKVTVEFKIKEDKTIEVISVETLNEYLKTYVKKQIEAISLSNYEGFEGKVLQLSLLFMN